MAIYKKFRIIIGFFYLFCSLSFAMQPIDPKGYSILKEVKNMSDDKLHLIINLIADGREYIINPGETKAFDIDVKNKTINYQKEGERYLYNFINKNLYPEFTLIYDPKNKKSMIAKPFNNS